MASDTDAEQMWWLNETATRPATALEDRAYVLEQDEQVVRVGGRLHETQPLVERSRVVIFGVHRHRSYAGNVGGLERPQHGVLEQTRTEPLALPTRGDRQTRE